jgi:hypothetical protein
LTVVTTYPSKFSSFVSMSSHIIDIVSVLEHLSWKSLRPISWGFG